MLEDLGKLYIGVVSMGESAMGAMMKDRYKNDYVSQI
jgi:hypothetical protein